MPKIIKQNSQPQIEKFREAAREAETDDSEANFDRVLKRITNVPAPAKGSKKTGSKK